MGDLKQRQLSIAEQNDEFRRRRFGGHHFITNGIQAMGSDFIAQLLAAVAAYDHFTPDNDPYGEHDFGALTIEGERVFWKIDYYAKGDLTRGSEDPADPSRTTRILTIMLADEY